MKTTITVELETSNMNEVTEINDINVKEKGDNISSYIEELMHKAFKHAMKTAFKNDYMEELILEEDQMEVDGFEYLYDYGDVIIKVEEEVVYDSKVRKEEEKKENELNKELEEIEDDLEPIIPKEDTENESTNS